MSRKRRWTRLTRRETNTATPPPPASTKEASGGFEAGQWEVVLEIVGGDGREVLTFTVTE